MNRTEALAVLTSITIDRTDVHGAPLGRGFFLADAVAAMGDFDRAVRHIGTLTRVGRVNCNKVVIGGTSHDLYRAV